MSRQAFARLRSATPFVVLLVVVAVRMVLREDLTFSDEAGYMAGGLRLLSGGKVPFSESPVYSYLYGLGALLFNDTITIYYFGRATGCIVLVLGIMLATRLLSSWRAAWFAGVIAAALAMTYYWPGVSALSTALLLVGCVLLIRPGGLRDGAWASVLFWLAAGVRTEYWPVALVATLGVMWLACTQVCSAGTAGEAVRPRSVLVALGAALAVPLLLLGLHGLPIGEGRLWVAFGQHYAFAQAGPDENPWLGWEAIVAEDFGDADNLIGAMAASPGDFFGHVWRSLRRVPQYAEWSFLDHAGGGLAGTLAVSAAATALLMVVLLGVVVLAVRAGGHAARVRPLSKSAVIRMIPVIVAALISAATMLVIWPRLHYLQPWVGALVVAVSIGAERTLPRGLGCLLTPVSVVLLASMIATGVYTAVFMPPDKPLVRTVHRLSASAEQHTLLSNTTGLDVYVPQLLKAAPPKAETTFSDYLATQGVDVVVVDANLRFGPWGQLPGYAEFNADPGVLGFAQIEPGAEVWARMGAVK